MADTSASPPRSGTSDELARFVGLAKRERIEDATIVALLRRNGWSERRAYDALSDYYATALGEAIPSKSGQPGDARAAFFYLLDFITLACWTIAVGQIFYVLIADRFPDAVAGVTYNESLRNQLSWQLATVLVAFPLYLFVHRWIAKQLEARPELYDSGVRKWLTYVALVIAALVVISDGVWFLYSLIRGEITVRFLLDTIVLLVLAGGVFAYYLITVDGPDRKPE